MAILNEEDRNEAKLDLGRIFDELDCIEVDVRDTPTAELQRKLIDLQVRAERLLSRVNTAQVITSYATFQDAPEAQKRLFMAVADVADRIRALREQPDQGRAERFQRADHRCQRLECSGGVKYFYTPPPSEFGKVGPTPKLRCEIGKCSKCGELYFVKPREPLGLPDVEVDPV